jgi:hypothetical protein
MNWGLMIVSCTLAMTLALANCSNATDSSNDSSYEELKAKVVSASKILEEGNLDGFVNALPGTQLAGTEMMDFLKKAKGTRLALPESVGAPLFRVALIREENSGTSFCQFSIEECYTNEMTLWRLVYYRGENGWQLRHIHFNPGEIGLQVSPKTTAILDKNPEETANTIMRELCSDKVVEGLEALTKDSHPNIAASAKGTDAQKIALSVQLDALNGNPPLNDFELIKTETTGPHLVRFHYIIRRKKQGHHVQLTFYKSKEEWKAIRWNWSNEGPPFFVAREGGESQTR